MASSFLDALLGIIANSGVPLELEGTLNFTGGLQAKRNQIAGTIDVTNTGDFANSETGGGNPTLKVSAERTDTIVTLLTATNVNKDFDLIPDNALAPVDGYYQITVNLVVKMITALSFHRLSAVIDGKVDSGTLTIVGVQTDLPGGDDTGLTLTLTADSDNLRANLANATGETVNGYVQIGWLRTDLI